MRTVHTVTFIDTDGNSDMCKVWDTDLSGELKRLAEQGIDDVRVSTSTYSDEQIDKLRQLFTPAQEV